MLIISRNRFDISSAVMADLMARVFSGADTHIYEFTPLNPLGKDGYNIHVSPIEESGFSVNVGADRQGFSLDGLDDQNAHAAVAIRNLMGDIGPVIAVEDDGSTFIDLVPGMDPDQFYEGWQPMDNIDRDVWS